MNSLSYMRSSNQIRCFLHSIRRLVKSLGVSAFDSSPDEDESRIRKLVGSPLPASFLDEGAFIIVAHPDDESVGVGVYLQRCCGARLSFLTSGESGASVARLVRKGKSSYLREEEAIAAHHLVQNVEIVGFGRLPDKELYKHLSTAATRLLEWLAVRPPRMLMTHAFEGGHPDHDCCSFLANRIGRQLGIPVWEFPEYSAHPSALIQKFSDSDTGDIVTLYPTSTEAKVKRQMFRLHSSQKAVLSIFDAAAPELFRIQPRRDYFDPDWSDYFSNPGYRSNDVSTAFKDFDRDFSMPLNSDPD